MRTLWLFGNQLTESVTGFDRIDRTKDSVLFIEARSRSNWMNYHKKKLVLIFSAMRHFADQLRKEGYHVDYIKANSFQDGWEQHFKKHQPNEVILHLPADWTMRHLLTQWQKEQTNRGLKLTYLEESHFIIKEQEWPSFLPDNKSWKLDPIYRKLRKQFNILMDNEKPAGGKWSYDSENRKPPKKGLAFTEPLLFSPDQVTKKVMTEVNDMYPANIGTTDHFSLPVTHKQANEALNHFLKTRLASFGDYQDAMMENEPYMSHSIISSALNIGLLNPFDVIERTEAAYKDGLAPLAATEGFIRQVLGWREYMRGIYLRAGPSYKSVNYFNHSRPLPNLYWNGQTKMNCLHQTVTEVIDNGYNHHIQRLMILGNFANLTGIRPQEVSDWFNTMYTDAHDWVVLPNVLGMALYADGGTMSTKPYISSGQYINKMSNYCKGCYYNVNQKIGEKACPFNALYWNFLTEHKDKLSTNPRMKMMYRLLDKKSPQDIAELNKQANSSLNSLKLDKL